MSMRIEGGSAEERALVALAYCDGGALREQAVARVVGVNHETAAEALRELRSRKLAEIESSGLNWTVWRATAKGQHQAWELLRSEACFARLKSGEPLVDVGHSPPRRRFFPSEVEALAKAERAKQRLARGRR